MHRNCPVANRFEILYYGMLPPGAQQRVAAYALLVNDGKILLCRIAGDNPHAGHWTLPGGGIDFGEDPAAAAVREVYEETGLRIAVRSVLKVESEVIRREEGPLHAIKIVYRGSIISGSLANEAAGSTDLCEWLTPEQCREQALVPLATGVLRDAFASPGPAERLVRPLS